MSSIHFHLCVFHLSTDRCALDWAEWSEEPDVVWMVWSLSCDLHQLAEWWTISCYQPPGGLCLDPRKGNIHNCPVVKTAVNGYAVIVSIFIMKDGKWADHMCEKTYGYICKKKASTKPTGGTQEEVNPGCKLVSNVA